MISECLKWILPSLLSLVRRRARALARRPIAHLRMRLAGGGALFSAGLELRSEGFFQRARCSSSQLRTRPGAGTSVATATGPDSRAGSSTVLRSASCPGAAALRRRPHASSTRIVACTLCAHLPA